MACISTFCYVHVFTGGVAMKQAVFVLSLLLLLSCTSQQGHDFAVNNTDQIKVGVTDKVTVERLLGPPLNKSIKGPDETWVYSYSATDTTAGAVMGGGMMVPIVGPLIYMGGLNTPITSDQREVTITFRKDTVQTCVVRLISTSGTMNNMQGGSTTREIACGQPVS